MSHLSNTRKTADYSRFDFPAQIESKSGKAVRQAVNESFVAGFRLVAYLTAGLALLGAASAWCLVEEKNQNATREENFQTASRETAKRDELPA